MLYLATLKRLISFFFTLCCLIGGNKAQQPLYFHLGMDGTLNGVEIYGINQAKNKELWLATSNGIYSYNGANFTHYKNKNLASNEFFNPQFDHNGKLMFVNLNQEILTLTNGTIEPYYREDGTTSPGILNYACIGPYIYYTTDSRLVRLDSNKNKTIIYEEPKAFAFTLFYKTLKSRGMEFYTRNLSMVFRISPEGQCKAEKYNSGQKNSDAFQGRFIYTTSGTILLHIKGFESHAYWVKESGIEPYLNLTGKVSVVPRYFIADDKGRLWSGMTTGGLEIQEPGKAPRPIFKNELINSIFQEEDGNYILGTQNNGIFIINNLDDMLMLEESNWMRNGIAPGGLLLSRADGIYYMDTNSGKIQNIFSGEITKDYSLIPLIPGEKYLSMTKTNFLVSTWNGKSFTNRILRNQYNSSVKNYQILPDGKLLTAHINGFSKWDFSKPDTLLHEKTGPQQVRTNSVFFDILNNRYWFSTVTGVYTAIGNTNTREIKRQGAKLSFYHIAEAENNIFGIDPEGSVFKLNRQTGDVSAYYKNPSPISYLTTCFTFRNIIWIIGKKSIHVFDPQSNRFKQLPIILPNPVYIQSGCIAGNNIWLTTNKGVVRFAYNKHLQKDAKRAGVIKLINVTLGTRLLDLNPENVSHVPYYENELSINLSASTLNFPGLLSIEYQLEGIDKNPRLASIARGIPSYKSLQPGFYRFKYRTIDAYGAPDHWRFLTFRINNPWWKQWWFFALLIIIILAVYLYQIRAIKDKQKLIQRLHESEIVAIKAQMNPHFIFNSLNSIQALILNKDIENSNIYLGKFSDLVRRTLDYSGKKAISLSQELEMLRLYLDLEKLRYSSDFSWEIKCLIPQSHAEEIDIPPMLIQPFVENSLKHGLLHKSGNKKLFIDCEDSGSDVIFTISDNGVGREKAAEIKKRQGGHTSFSSSAIQKRIDLINSTSLKPLKLEISDLQNASGMPEGTSVKLVVPYRS